MQALAGQLWPGPLTLVVPCGPQVPEVITAGAQTVAVRVPAHPVALRLFALTGQSRPTIWRLCSARCTQFKVRCIRVVT
jgi:tRNA A37 threonylcarbamoyladenosine synthetase subunit TsaC/SUA5/YrdC